MQRTIPLNQVLPDLDHIRSFQPGPQQDGDQFPMAERVRPFFSEPLARPLTGRLVLELHAGHRRTLARNRGKTRRKKLRTRTAARARSKAVAAEVTRRIWPPNQFPPRCLGYA